MTHELELWMNGWLRCRPSNLFKLVLEALWVRCFFCALNGVVALFSSVLYVFFGMIGREFRFQVLLFFVHRFFALNGREDVLILFPSSLF